MSKRGRQAESDNERTIQRAYRRAFYVRNRNALVTAFACAAVGITITYLASASPLFGGVVAALSLIATVILTVGVYVLHEPVANNLEEFAEIMGDRT
jgi:hypothetical protein